ncbi:protein-glutamate O-methyltransferase CheR [Erythrobacter sp. F6033]|uniref:CheR family methyltransferase n=1 Tax=Erythrobacter sp. F6033 TaxID=2926401 RepID=UPI001FF6D368|nr:protein-glutamate O-methyltransferase CheR [Erythrobacter sp. F6033]MCK0129220.1 protein-glutamate O-methyltransferase CheR [Erythrobacter sp. F6033]
MEVSQASYQIIADLLEARTGQHLTESRRWRVGTALSGVFREHGITNVDQLVCLLDLPMRSPGKPDLSQQVVEALLNNETYFFRDKPTFDQLPENILPEIAERRKDTKRISIWCAGCSTGQEVHSLAMLFVDSADRWKDWTIEILGTDVSHRVINAARNGVYSQFEVQRGLGIAQMLRHFEETSQGWQVHEATRALSRFQQHNLLSEPPSRHRFDLILCRNVLLYFDQAMRERAFSRLSSALADDGVLMLGAGETVVGQTTAFRPLPKRASMYTVERASARIPHTAVS